MIMVLRNVMSALLVIVMLSGAGLPAMADDNVTAQTIIEDFTMQPETRWRFFTDQVMGGVSTGGVAFTQEAGTSFARMTGRVTTANRGGFIQMRLDLATSPPAGTTGVRLIVRGNDQRYFVHLRTGGTLLPWQYYQAGFDVIESWSEVRLPLDAFSASGGLLRSVPAPSSLTSLGIVAYGRDHDAQIDVREVGFY
jgi:Complex I intermediate-associated protein 30 (CIA30)